MSCGTAAAIIPPCEFAMIKSRCPRALQFCFAISTMLNLLSVSIFLLGSLGAFAQDEESFPNDPAPEPFSYNDVLLKPNLKNDSVHTSVVLRGWEGCDAKDPCGNPILDKRVFITSGFREMQKMIPDETIPGELDPENRYLVNWVDASAVEFFGPGWITREHRAAVHSKLPS